MIPVQRASLDRLSLITYASNGKKNFQMRSLLIGKSK